MTNVEQFQNFLIPGFTAVGLRGRTDHSIPVDGGLIL